MHTILHIGAGQAHELPQWLETGAERILLVEPNPELAEQLRENTRSEPGVTVIEAAITSNPASNQLHEYNLPEASSLRPATGLKQLFPGLKTVTTHSVATLTPAQLMEQYGPEPGEPATLVLQAPGEEHAIIQALAEAEELSHFNQLLITANPEPLYEGSEAAETLLNTLQTLGYNLQQENQQDPDWPTWQLARDPQQDKIAALNQDLQALEEQLKDKSTNLLELTQQKEALKQQLTLAQQQKTELEKAKTVETERANTTAQKLNQAEAAFSAKVQAEQQARKQLEQLKQQIAATENQQQQHQADLAKQAEQLKALEQQLAEAQQQKAEADQRSQSAEQALTEAEKARSEADKARNQAEEARAEEKEQQKAREQKLNAELEALRQQAQQLPAAKEALAKEQNAHKQTASALEQARLATTEKEQAHKAAKDTLQQQHQAALAKQAEQLKALEQQLAEAQQQKAEADQRSQSAEQALAEAEKARSEADKARTQAEKARAEEKEQQKAREEKLNAELEKLREQAQQLAPAKDALAKEQNAHKQTASALEQARQTIAEKDQQLINQANTQNALNTLQERMEYLFGQNTLQLEQATNALGQHVSQTVQNTASELEAGIALQQLAPGTLAHSQSENSIPKSAALALTRQLKAKTYDIIIDLGGTTTRLLADILKNANQEQPQEKNDQKSLTHYIEASEEDLPKRIVSFSHNRNHQKELADQLKTTGAASYVNLQFAPLVPFQYQNREHLFYDCGNSLQQISQLFDGRQAKILIMLASQTDQTGPDPRAALPACLQYLSAHQLDLIINTSDNHQLMEESLNLLNQRQLDHTQPKAIGAGQMQQITVNP